MIGDSAGGLELDDWAVFEMRDEMITAWFT
jgi:hypothetical protein